MRPWASSATAVASSTPLPPMVTEDVSTGIDHERHGRGCTCRQRSRTHRHRWRGTRRARRLSVHRAVPATPEASRGAGGRQVRRGCRSCLPASALPTPRRHGNGCSRRRTWRQQEVLFQPAAAAAIANVDAAVDVPVADLRVQSTNERRVVGQVVGRPCSRRAPCRRIVAGADERPSPGAHSGRRECRNVDLHALSRDVGAVAACVGRGRTRRQPARTPAAALSLRATLRQQGSRRRSSSVRSACRRWPQSPTPRHRSHGATATRPAGATRGATRRMPAGRASSSP